MKENPPPERQFKVYTDRGGYEMFCKAMRERALMQTIEFPSEQPEKLF